MCRHRFLVDGMAARVCSANADDAAVACSGELTIAMKYARLFNNVAREMVAPGKTIARKEAGHIKGWQVTEDS